MIIVIIIYKLYTFDPQPSTLNHDPWTRLIPSGKLPLRHAIFPLRIGKLSRPSEDRWDSAAGLTIRDDCWNTCSDQCRPPRQSRPRLLANTLQGFMERSAPFLEQSAPT